MDVVWWLIFTAAVIWQLHQGLRRLHTASRRIDTDIAAFNREHPRAAAVVINSPRMLTIPDRRYQDRTIPDLFLLR